MPDYVIEGLGHQTLPDELCEASEAEVEAVLRRAAASLGVGDVEIRRVASVIGGSCIACTDVVAYSGGVAVLVAKPSLY